jgi:hypothetical protein
MGGPQDCPWLTAIKGPWVKNPWPFSIEVENDTARTIQPDQ